MWQKNHFAKEIVRQTEMVFCLLLFFLSLKYDFVKEMKHVYCVWDYNQLYIFVRYKRHKVSS